MTCSVVDTNVVLVANGQHEAVSPACVAECALRLQAVMRDGHLALDDRFRILSEYQNKTQARRGKQPGDAFVKWALQNNANASRVHLVKILEHGSRGFESFPDDRELEMFDPPDRKFVAVARSHADRPPILQAADSKWLGWAAALSRHQVEVDFLCKADIERFQAQKAKAMPAGAKPHRRGRTA